VTVRLRRRSRNLLDDLKERRGYSYLKDEALCGGGFGPVVRQTTKLMKFVGKKLWKGHC
jgi:hypothetical protein